MGWNEFEEQLENTSTLPVPGSSSKAGPVETEPKQATTNQFVHN
jgi:hypothetical protein